MKNAPAYPIASVDHALRLLDILRGGPVHLSQAAEELGVARSTAHRLLAMLVYRGFAEQDDSRRYIAGPSLRVQPMAPAPLDELISIARRYMQLLVNELRETVNLMVLVDDHVQFLATIECDRILRVGDRRGLSLPAHLASGGCALLAELDDADILSRYSTTMSKGERAELLAVLQTVRRRGYAVNDQRTEAGVTAIGSVVHGRSGATVAVSVAMPTARCDRRSVPTLAQALRRTAADVERAVTVGVHM